ncbi:MAG: hypothetical protein OXO49_07460 [Gammaproteobacteria bacterium]|nr:hypothetical protein [Gammaproteobacteria bacterium]MDE0251690.1 hypothetical protein [Gammaproteobacteria bacterium]MDE0403301.1 hypothetical protein [Gammaproteobacteria bacterium]
MKDSVDQRTKHLTLEFWVSFGIAFALVLNILDPWETLLGRLLFSFVIVVTAVVVGLLFTALKKHLDQQKVLRERT